MSAPSNDLGSRARVSPRSGANVGFMLPQDDELGAPAHSKARGPAAAQEDDDYDEYEDDFIETEKPN